MLDKRKKSVVLILLGLMMLAGLLGCSDSSDAPQETDSSSNAPEENDRIVGEVGTGAARCKALSFECGYGYDYQAYETVDLWELSTDGSYWLFKEEYANGGARCEALQSLAGGDGFQIRRRISMYGFLIMVRWSLLKNQIFHTYQRFTTWRSTG